MVIVKQWWKMSLTAGGEGLHEADSADRMLVMSTVQEIEAAIPKLSVQELERLKSWFDDFYEDRLELADDVKAKLNQAREEIQAGSYRTRQAE